MKMSKFRSAALIVGLLALCAPVPAEAQFLKKLGKSLEKVNKGLEKVNKALDGKPVEKNSTTARKSDGPAPTAKQTVNTSGWKKYNKVPANHPYVDGKTLFLQKGYVQVSPVQEDVFALKDNGKFEFWRINGKKLFNADWEYCGSKYSNQFPMFNGGVAPARRATPNAAGKKPICLLYLDGRVKEMDPSWEQVSEFCDGLALVKKRLSRGTDYFYINSAGERVYPNLGMSGSVSQEDAMRPLRDGLRAYQYGCRIIGDRYESNEIWGFINEQGVPVLQGFSQVRDFSEGYAWVVRNKGGEMELIDTKGNTVFKPGIVPHAGIYGNRHFSDVHNGIVMVEGEGHGATACYYNVKGEKLGEFKSGTRFYDGYAFVDEAGQNSLSISQVYMLDTSMREVRHMSEKVMPNYVVAENKANFEPYGLGTWLADATNYVVTPDATVILTDWESADNSDYIRSFGQFSKSGYSFVDDIRLADVQYNGLMSPDGHLAWLFSGDAVRGVRRGDAPPIEPDPGDPRDSIGYIIIRPDLPPIGPTVVTATKYNVKVSPSPAEGGSVSLSASGPFEYGTYVTVNAVPASKEWAAVSITSNKPDAKAPLIGKPFPVTADMDLTVNFVKRDDETPPSTSGYYQGSIRLIGDITGEAPVYAEISSQPNVETPYGKNTYGYLVIMLDPRTRYVGKNMAVNLFCGPLLICGETRDEATGKEWLILDGGATSAGNLIVGPNNGDPMGMLMNMMLAFDGFNNVSVKPRHYRVEILDRNKDTGEFTLGLLETFSDSGRWVPGGDRSLCETTKGFFGTATDTGYKADTFTGIEMKKAAKRTDVDWFPPAEFFDGKEGLVQSALKALTNSYRNVRSNYYDLFP